jgi:hypothetical protein
VRPAPPAVDEYREIVDEIARALFVQRALSKQRFKLAFQTKQISVNRFELDPQFIGRLPIATSCNRLIKFRLRRWKRRIHLGGSKRRKANLRLPLIGEKLRNRPLATLKYKRRAVS